MSETNSQNTPTPPIERGGHGGRGRGGKGRSRGRRGRGGHARSHDAHREDDSIMPNEGNSVMAHTPWRFPGQHMMEQEMRREEKDRDIASQSPLVSSIALGITMPSGPIFSSSKSDPGGSDHDQPPSPVYVRPATSKADDGYLVSTSGSNLRGEANLKRGMLQAQRETTPGYSVSSASNTMSVPHGQGRNNVVESKQLPGAAPRDQQRNSERQVPCWPPPHLDPSAMRILTHPSTDSALKPAPTIANATTAAPPPSHQPERAGFPPYQPPHLRAQPAQQPVPQPLPNSEPRQQPPQPRHDHQQSQPQHATPPRHPSASTSTTTIDPRTSPSTLAAASLDEMLNPTIHSLITSLQSLHYLLPLSLSFTPPPLLLPLYQTHVTPLDRIRLLLTAIDVEIDSLLSVVERDRSGGNADVRRWKEEVFEGLLMDVVPRVGELGAGIARAAGASMEHQRGGVRLWVGRNGSDG